jgi:branched-chain amino acid transport system ATP-binding protein
MAVVADQAPERGVLACSEVTKRYGGFVALNDLSLTIGDREILGIAGPNGAGKTTLFDVVSGHQRLDAGRVWLGGKDVTKVAVHRRARMGLGRTFQAPVVLAGVTVDAAFRVALTSYRPLVGAEDVTRVRDIVGLDVPASMLCGDLDTLDRRKLVLASLLLRQPSVLLLDEPCAGLLQEEIDEIVAIIKKIASEFPMSIAVIEHRLEFLAAVATRIAVMDEGKVIAEGEPGAVFEDPVVKAAYFDTVSFR